MPATAATADSDPGPGAGPGLFGSYETRGNHPHAFTKWAEMLARHQWEESRRGQKLPCTVAADFTCPEDHWQALLARLAGQPPRAQIDAVNEFINQIPYRSDRANWGIGDYWTTPREFLNKGGDCEDYVIAKYFSLKALGFPPERLRIVIVEDTNLKLPHAVLTVSHGGVTLVLDNQVQTVVRAASILHYRPIYSLNETAWWLHHQ